MTYTGSNSSQYKKLRRCLHEAVSAWYALMMQVIEGGYGMLLPLVQFGSRCRHCAVSREGRWAV